MRTDEDWCEDYAELDDQLTVSRKWSKVWKSFGKKCRKMLVNEMIEMQRTHRQLQDMMDNGKRNPGLLLAGLVMEAAQDGVDPGQRAAECMGWAFAHYLSNFPEAPNYLQVTLEGGDNKPIYVTVQRPDGKTPHQMRMEAEAERDKLRRELEELKAQGECRS